MCPTHRCEDGCRINPQSIHEGAKWFAGIGLFILVGVPVIAKIVGHLAAILETVGAVTAVVVGLYAYIKYVQWRYRQAVSIAPPPHAQVPYRARTPVGEPRQALPAAVHHHHGNELVLPGVTDEGLAKLLRDGQ